MITFQGKNLCERQKELNLKVKEAAQQKVNFQDVKSAQEYSDVDRLFKIDLASKYKDTDYFIEVLKCGDSLYISRALKWEWIYEDAYSHIINPDYLHHFIFPTMSFKMKIKTLSTISKHIRDEPRAQLFYEYCINTNMKNNAYKFLKFTSVSFKKELLPDFVEDDRDSQNHKDMIGNSLLLADVYGEKCRGRISDLSYLYSVNDDEYLNLFEKHTKINDNFQYYSYKVLFGGKMSRSILKKHKTRILNKPLPYLSVLKKSELVKYCSSDDARIFAVALLPKEADQFWRTKYYKTHKHILDLVKAESIFEFIKQIFSDKYPNEAFELTKEFYESEYYELMTVKERETWALMHIEKKTGVIPEDEDYRWYGFVNFPRAFEEIKKKIRVTTNSDKRSNMLNTLIKSATSQNELKELLNYYYQRHVNERSHLKNRFLKNVTEVHSVFEFDGVCWAAFDKLLHSLDVYNSCSGGGWNEFLCDSLVYHIINKMTLTNNLTQHLNTRRYLDNIKERSDMLCAAKKDLVYDYIFQFLTEKIKGFDLLDYTEEVKKQVRGCLQLMIRWKGNFKKDGEFPVIALKFMKLDLDSFGDIVNPKPATTEKDISEGFLIRCLKQDPTVILENFSLIEKKFNWPNDFRLNTVLKKIKIYFSNDLAKKYLDLCKTSLSNISSKGDEKNGIIFHRNAIFANIYAIFQLGDEHTKTEFMDLHAPTNSKIEYDKIDQYLMYTQEAICRLHCYSRPPVPLAKSALYLKGDYVHLSNDMFNTYLMKLTPTPRTEFIKFLLNSPVSIQKRGLRLAFHAFETSELKDVVSNVWQKTKNVSVRSNLYISIVEKIKTEKKKSQLELFKLLKELTVCIHQDDDEEIFKYFTGNKIPEYLRGDYLETVWKTVLALPDNKANIERRTVVAEAMKSNIVLIDESHVEVLVYGHVRKRLSQEELRPEENSHIEPLNEALWDFVVEYIVNVDTELKQQKSLNVIKLIVDECFNHWNETHNTENFVYQLFFKDFVSKLDCIIYYYRTTYSSRVTRIFEYLLECFENKFALREMYSYYWDWKLSVITRTVINGRDEFDKEVYISFGSILGTFVKKLKNKNCYYSSFLSKIMGKIKEFIQILNIRKPESITDCDLKVLIAYGLTLQKTLETSMLALHMLPQDLSTISVAGNELQEVIKTIRKQDNEELKAFMNDKFIYSDCKVRKIMIT
ncbi:uncharacterized protein LOC133520510 [Cydia pomonella]|uniref:uncharacterized protein LOC133520510 n=1 Tax=Cydia pomonella TaxID=82600 RepID=UPI002ADDE1E9|nr:uncharacterized protein LOC133520510 [Cydia pomonella]XP_061710959.1 uncharacterized protein LOC133520510 [Cydia pomonella]XP_061710960.1 uncharacterized protein LOC133520510 [Cydia pomonella]XP_061710961.1 uncharacterized protein LOC133520510 [Cydia pomonella]